MMFEIRFCLETMWRGSTG